jgi:hypothetical protein
MAPWHFVIYARISLQNWRPPLTLCINYMIYTHTHTHTHTNTHPWRSVFPMLQFHSIILRHWTSLKHTGTIIIFMLLLQRWRSLAHCREICCVVVCSQACLMQRNSSVSPFVILNHKSSDYETLNCTIHVQEFETRASAMLCFAVWVGGLFQIFYCFGKQSHM